MMEQVQMYNESTEGIYVSDVYETTTVAYTYRSPYTIFATDNRGRHETGDDDGPAAAYEVRTERQTPETRMI